MQYMEIVANGTYTVKQGNGYFQGITVNVPGSGTVQIFDNTAGSGTAIAGATAFALPAAGSYMDYDCHFNKGLTFVIASMVSGSITVEWY